VLKTKATSKPASHERAPPPSHSGCCCGTRAEGQEPASDRVQPDHSVDEHGSADHSDDRVGCCGGATSKSGKSPPAS
jgi:hypothetical protein